MHIFVCWIWGEAHEPAFLMNSQVIPELGFMDTFIIKRSMCICISIPVEKKFLDSIKEESFPNEGQGVLSSPLP